MNRMLFRVVAALSVTTLWHSLSAQTTTVPPAFSFSAPKRILTGAVSQPGNTISITAMDLNGDGNTDLYAQELLSGASGSAVFQNLFLAGDGNGGFALSTTSNTNDPNNPNPFFPYDPTGPFYPPAVFVDLNGDGNLDTLYIDPGSYNVNVCPPTLTLGAIDTDLGDGTGNFNTTGYGFSIDAIDSLHGTTGDFNHDRLMDVVLFASYPPLKGCGETIGSAIALMLLNNGDGTFASTFNYRNNMQISWGSAHPVVGDFNADGNLDLAFIGRGSITTVPTPTTNVIQVLYGSGDGTFTVGPIYTVDSAVDNILAADLNGDGKTDLVVLAEPKTPGNPFRIATLLAKQASGFYWASELETSNPVTLIGLMDLNNDGKPDLPFYSYDPATKVTSLRAYPGLGQGKFGVPSLIRKLAPNENDVIAPLKRGGPLNILYALSYPPGKDVYVYEMLNLAK